MYQEAKMLDSVEAYSKAFHTITESYEIPERRKFINYLISKFYRSDPYFILFSKTQLVDSLSGSALNTVFDRDHPMKRGKLKNLIDSYKGKSQEEKEKLSEEVQKILKESKIQKERPRLAVSLDGVRRVLGYDEYNALRDWIEENKLINKSVRSITNYIDRKLDGDKHDPDNDFNIVNENDTDTVEEIVKENKVEVQSQADKWKSKYGSRDRSKVSTTSSKSDKKSDSTKKKESNISNLFTEYSSSSIGGDESLREKLLRAISQ